MLCSILAVFLLLASNIVDDADGPGEEEDEGGEKSAVYLSKKSHNIQFV